MASMKPVSGDRCRVTWYDTVGVRHRKVLPKKAAQELYDQVCAAKFFESSGLNPATTQKAKNFKKLTFGELASRYINEHLLTYTRADSNAYYVNVLAHKWGMYRLPCLSLNDFRDWILHALDNPIPAPKKNGIELIQFAAGTVKKLVIYMGAVLNWAVSKEIISENPFPPIIDDKLEKEFRRRDDYDPVTLTVEEFWPMVDSFPWYLRNPAIVSFFSGIRRSEICALKWQDLSIKERRMKFWASDTKETRRKVVFYDQEADQVFNQLEVERIANDYPGDSVVFRNIKGGPLTEDSLSQSMRDYCDRFANKSNNPKYHEVTFHTLRRSYRTRKDREGMDRKAVMGKHGP